MFQGLSGKVALVTGGSSGLGEAIVCRLAAEGASVVVAGRDEQRTHGVAATALGIARRAGRRETEMSAVFGDVALVADCDRMVADAVAVQGRLDVLVNCAGIWLEKPITAMTEADYDVLMDCNLKGTYFMCRAALAHMAPRRSGVIVNLASDSGLHGEPGAAAYAATYILIGYFFGKKWKLLEAWLGPTALYLILAGIALIVLGVIFRHSLPGLLARLFPKNHQRK